MWLHIPSPGEEEEKWESERTDGRRLHPGPGACDLYPQTAPACVRYGIPDGMAGGRGTAPVR